MKRYLITLMTLIVSGPAFAQAALYSNSTTGQIGIGTTSPANSLDVNTGGGIHIGSGTPSSTANALYAIGTTLEWNGAPVGGGSTYDIYADPDTALLMHMDNNASDSSIFGNTFTNTGVTFSNTVSKFGGYSAFFNGSATTNTSLVSQSSPPIACSPNCTIDLWARFSGNIPYVSSGGNYGESLFIGGSPGTPALAVQVSSGSVSGPPSTISVYNGSNTIITTSFAFALNTWYHIAVEIINGSAAYLWINGTPKGSATSGVSTPSAQAYTIGYQNSSGYYYPMLGYIDEMRISAAVRYQPNVAFTPPTAAYNPGPIQ